MKESVVTKLVKPPFIIFAVLFVAFPAYAQCGCDFGYTYRSYAPSYSYYTPSYYEPWWSSTPPLRSSTNQNPPTPYVGTGLLDPTTDGDVGVPSGPRRKPRTRRKPKPQPPPPLLKA